MKTKHLIISAGLLFRILTLNAQDVHFSQVTETPLLLNPAQAGLSHDFLGIINYKDQWRKVAVTPYKTFNVSGDLAFMKKDNGSHLGVGLDIFSDKAGDGNMSTTTGQLDLSGVLATDDHNLLSAGLYGGFGQRTLEYDKMQWDNQYDGMHYDPTLPSLEPNSFANHSYLDFGAGLAWFYGTGHATISSNDARLLTLGMSVQHLNRPTYSYYGDVARKLPVRYVFHGSAEIGIKNYSLVLEPAYNVFLQAGHHEIYAGLMVKYITQESSHYTGRKKPSGIVLGGYLRAKDAVCFAARYEYSFFAVGMSYDVNISDLKTATNARGGAEFSIRFMSPDPYGKVSTSRLFD